MTKEELLRPRYKVIGNYPCSTLWLGEVLYQEKTALLAHGNYGFNDIEVSEYPHLFKKMEWWEDRKPDEMPEYVAYEGGVYQIENVNEFGWIQLKNFDKHKVSWHSLYPANKEDYDMFINNVFI